MRGKALKFVGIMGGVVVAIVIALGAKTLVGTSTVPPPPKPYDVAMYGVDSDLLPQQEETLLARLLIPQPEAVLIRVESLSLQDLQDSGPFKGYGGSGLALVPEERFKPSVDSATADYARRNKQSFQLQRKFNLSKYDLFTKAEEQAFRKEDPSACQKYAGYERWVELSAVGFNQDQTVAVVHFNDWRGRPCSNTIVGATGKDRMLQKRGAKWHLLANQVFSDPVSDE